MRGVTAMLAGPLPVIHAVTDSTSVLQTGFVDRATRVMEALGKRGAVHLRCSRASGRQFHDIAAALVAEQNRTGCWLIVNDRVDIALAVGAKGVQLASHSLLVAEALTVGPDMLVGASVHSVEEAVEAEKAGASWCVAGTIFETPSHKGRPPARIEFVKMLAAAVTLPIIAIGGVKPENVADLINGGAYGVATIRGAAWEGHEKPADPEDMTKTRLTMRVDSGFVEPVTRYISAYDSVSGTSHNDHLDGERSTT
ncbi:MAG TPA: thiamine phosphate synthase [Gemmatimonadaceae bacterium]|nr:thiamine phosphate synthase [Gemmatimonadaceae bacterium]